MSPLWQQLAAGAVFASAIALGQARSPLRKALPPAIQAIPAFPAGAAIAAAMSAGLANSLVWNLCAGASVGVGVGIFIGWLPYEYCPDELIPESCHPDRERPWHNIVRAIAPVAVSGLVGGLAASLLPALCARHW